MYTYICVYVDVCVYIHIYIYVHGFPNYRRGLSTCQYYGPIYLKHTSK